MKIVVNQLPSVQVPRGPPIEYSISLHDLKHASARRNSKLMALVLNEGCNNAEVCFRPRPQGPSEQPHLRVGSPCKVVNITAGSRLDLRPLCRPEILNTQSEAPKDYSQLTASEQGSRLCYTRLISCVEIL